ncbi:MULTISPECIES: hypothetical protein [Vibrio]|uniref:hypothetical protein n=1 Tax=Vibrio TaxID=662 RepID=UPI0006193B77|nr:MULTISPECIES: hypothetical protein [Vibrio]
MLPTTFQNTIYAVDHGVIADDGIDDSTALQAIIDNEVNVSTSNNTMVILPWFWRISCRDAREAC